MSEIGRKKVCKLGDGLDDGHGRDEWVRCGRKEGERERRGRVDGLVVSRCTDLSKLRAKYI